MAAIGSSSSRKQQAITMVLVLLWLGVVVVPPAASCGGHPCMIADSGVGTGGGKTRSQSKNRAWSPKSTRSQLPPGSTASAPESAEAAASWKEKQLLNCSRCVGAGREETAREKLKRKKRARVGRWAQVGCRDGITIPYQGRD